MQHKRIALLSSIAVLVAAPAHAELNLWQQNFVGCSTSASPYVNDVLFKDTAATRPLMQIAGMQAWSVPDGKGGQQLAMTTPDGLTIYGRVMGPQGEDISGALLAMPAQVKAQAADNGRGAALDRPVQAGVAASVTPSTLAPAATSVMNNKTVPPAAAPDIQGASPSSGARSPSAGSSPSISAAPPAPPSPSETTAVATPAPTPGASQNPAPGAQAGIGSQTVLDVPKATNLEELIKQAEDFAMWAPMNNPRPGAPVVYMFVDPTCPHCAWSLDHLEPKIRDGSVALRMIMAPILSEEALHIGISIIQSDNPGEALLQQAKLAIGSKGRAVDRIDPARYDQRVKDGISRNVQWMRANGIPGVPFYLYRTAQKTEFAFGSLSDAQLATAVAGDAAVANGQANAALPSPAGALPPPANTNGVVK